jgi:hypothetical protein
VLAKLGFRPQWTSWTRRFGSFSVVRLARFNQEQRPGSLPDVMLTKFTMTSSQYLLISGLRVIYGLLMLFCSVSQAQNLAQSLPEAPGSRPGMQSATSQPNSVTTSRPSAPITGVPTDHVVKDGTYRNNFFQFSIQFPQVWKILGTGAPLTQTGSGSITGGIATPPGSSIETRYVLFLAGTVDKQTQGPRWVYILAVKPSSGRNVTAEKYLKTEAEVVKAGSAEYLKKGQTPPRTAGEPREFRISGRRMFRLDETAQVNNRATNVVWFAIDEHGYLILFMFADPTGDESNYQAAKTINSLRFFGRAD